MSGLTPDQVQQIHEFIHNQQLIYAIKLYREATGVGLADAKEAVEAMARGEAIKPPAGMMDYDNPILTDKIRSLLSKRQKIEAIKIYREEYGVALKEAKDAVDRIELDMKRSGSPVNAPYESAIGGDPFADSDGGGKRVVAVLLAAIVALAICGAGGLFFLVGI